MLQKYLYGFGLLILLILAFGVSIQSAAAAIYPCTQAGLNTGLATGGLVQFNCATATTIIVTNTKTIGLNGTIVDGRGLLTISGGDAVRVFNVPNTVTATIQSLTIANGLADASLYAGGVFNAGNLTLINTTLTGNNGGGGSAITSDSGSNLNVYNSLIANNSSGSDGIVQIRGFARFINTTVVNNIGRAIMNRFGGNTTLINVTVANNGGTGLANAIPSTNVFTVTNSIIANNNEQCENIGAPDAGLFVSNGYNLVSNTSCNFTNTGDLQNSNPRFGVLGNYGGLTQSLNLLPGSPAINAANNNVCATALPNGAAGKDQRSNNRPAGGVCDIGAYENGFTVNVNTNTADSTPNDVICFTGQATDCSLRAAIGQSNAFTDTDIVFFNLAAGSQTIAPNSALPAIIQPIFIDGLSQTGASCNVWPPTLVVQLSGANSGGANGLVFNGGSDGSTLRGLVINRFNRGVSLNATDNNLIQCNFVGTNTTGTAALANTSDGIYINNTAQNNLIGSDNDGQQDSTERNLVSGNGTNGVHILDATTLSNRLGGNYIGTNVSGTVGLANTLSGVLVEGAKNSQIVSNTIAFNGGVGVNVIQNTATGNAIRNNSIYSNNGLGIDLGGNGVTNNDNGDADTGPNNLQNYPVLSAATLNGATTYVAGRLNSLANTTFSLDYFATPTCDGSGFGEGRTFLGTTTFTTDAGGNALFQTSFPTSVPLGSFLSATATDPAGNTSEFSNCTIVNGLPTITIANRSQTEGTGGVTNLVFTATLNVASAQTVTVDYATANGSATAPADYTATSGTLTFGVGITQATFTVSINPDSLDEPNETFVVNFTTPTNSTLGNPQATGTILDDDNAPTISINDASTSEGNIGTTPLTFTVTLNAASGMTITVNYATVDGTATIANNDYQNASGTLVFAPGQISRLISVNIVGDTRNEPTENFVINLTNPNNATLADGQAVGTITNDDNAPSVSIGDVSLVEGNAGTTNLVFTVTLSTASGQSIMVDYATADGTATIADNDYQSANGTLNFAPDQLSKTIIVRLVGDTTAESNETFLVNLTNPVNATIGDGQAVGTILDDDAPPTLSIRGASVIEGNVGTTALVLSVTLSIATNQNVTVNYSTGNNTATTADNDYISSSGALTFLAGEVTKIITITVIADTRQEADETLLVFLLNPVGATLALGQALGTIVNDDTCVALQVAFTTDDGAGMLCGTLSYAIVQANLQAMTATQTINFVTGITRVTLSANLPILRAGVRIIGSCGARVEINGGGIATGLQLNGGIRLEGLYLRGFSGTPLIAKSTNGLNQLVCMWIGR